MGEQTDRPLERIEDRKKVGFCLSVEGIVALVRAQPPSSAVDRRDLEALSEPRDHGIPC
jgi:hypothetical protein